MLQRLVFLESIEGIEQESEGVAPETEGETIGEEAV